MGGRRRLRSRLERIYPDHRSRDGRAYQRLFAAIAEELPLATPLLRLEGSRVAALGVLALNATLALTTAQAKAARGRGRRPSPRQIERLARRQGLANGSYSQALDRLRELTARRRPLTLAEQLSGGDGT